MELSAGNVGDSCDNALTESVIGLFTTEGIRRRGMWRGLEDVAFAMLEWVSWYNTLRLLEPIGYVPPWCGSQLNGFREDPGRSPLRQAISRLSMDVVSSGLDGNRRPI